MADCYLLLDKDCRVVWAVNLPPPYQVADLAGKPLWTVLQPSESERLQAAILRATLTNEPQGIEFVLSKVGIIKATVIVAPEDSGHGLIVLRRVPSEVTALSERERQICGLLAAGLAPKAIASTLNIMRSTVDNHRHRVAQRLRIRSSALDAWCGQHKEFLANGSHLPVAYPTK